MSYVQSKRAYDALNILGLSTNKLILFFLGLTFLLILLFVFIFLGIEACSLGGTFESLVSSCLPLGRFLVFKLISNPF
jgi:hypothetical protein